MQRNVMNIIGSMEKQGIRDGYEMRAKDFLAVDEISRSKYELISNSFVFGYAQSMKAAKKEMKAV